MIFWSFFHSSNSYFNLTQFSNPFVIFDRTLFHIYFLVNSLIPFFPLKQICVSSNNKTLIFQPLISKFPNSSVFLTIFPLILSRSSKYLLTKVLVLFKMLFNSDLVEFKEWWLETCGNETGFNVVPKLF